MNKRLLLAALAVAAPSAFAQADLCEITAVSGQGSQGIRSEFGLRAKSPADEVVRDVLRYSGLYFGGGSPDFILVDTYKIKDNAIASVCPDGQRYIFYDPDFIGNLRAVGGKDWPKYFVFAHEVGHHLRNHPLGARGDRRRHELDADAFAGFILARMGASLEEILAGVDSIASEIDTITHPGRCRRRAAATDAYNLAAEQMGRPVAPVMRCGGGVVLRGLYLIRPVGAGVAITEAMVRLAGSETGGLDRPTVFSEHVTGLCAAEALPAGELLSWQNLALCPGITR
jgi:hypothetical protein